MDALNLLLTRRSIAKLTAPAPKGVELKNILQAGLRAPDHGGLMPWQFVVVEGEGLDRFSTILSEAAIASGEEQKVIEKAKNAPFRAPMIIVVIAKVTEHEKVPLIEQYVSAGCATQSMQMAAVAQGFSGFWRTGKWTYDRSVRHAFSLQKDDEIIGFLYLGTPTCTPSALKEKELDKFVSYL
ncbi:NAD(P)H nitroreductase [Vibrio sp. SS-MA-C1-2]|uniref:NAD(P)H nitroreductase n=1 Tax=Vibrio sp. SS-MA-C1-2 TaxID=2908646 RepID=UPI001F46FA38|nr:NAD(P)H nitroreductase [Vibrio sp. SS-MA-C1-2]UJF19856.1 NAD(P)H nitroreductase [Vibrio sp. SS-MA-C1-2]